MLLFLTLKCVMVIWTWCFSIEALQYRDPVGISPFKILLAIWRRRKIVTHHHHMWRVFEWNFLLFDTALWCRCINSRSNKLWRKLLRKLPLPHTNTTSHQVQQLARKLFKELSVIGSPWNASSMKWKNMKHGTYLEGCGVVSVLFGLKPRWGQSWCNFSCWILV